MKKVLSILGVTFFMNLIVVAQLPNPDPNLDQSLLLKQFEGSWHCEIGKDTSAVWDMQAYGIGYVASLIYILKGKIIKEGKGVYGYDEKTGRIAEAGITRGKNIGVFSMWFVTDKKFVLIPYIDLENPEKASFRMEGEFRDPGMLIETTFISNSKVNVKTWTNTKH
jgi:hypothetical protein